MRHTHSTQGFALVEIIVSAAIAAIAATALFSTMQLLLRVGLQTVEERQAVFLAEQGIEVARHLRDRGWAESVGAYAVDVPYYVYRTSTGWSATTTPTTTLDGFSRIVTFGRVYRSQADDDIVEEGAQTSYLDEHTVRVVVRVDGARTSAELVTYLTNLFET